MTGNSVNRCVSEAARPRFYQNGALWQDRQNRKDFFLQPFGKTEVPQNFLTLENKGFRKKFREFLEKIQKCYKCYGLKMPLWYNTPPPRNCDLSESRLSLEKQGFSAVLRYPKRHKRGVERRFLKTTAP